MRPFIQIECHIISQDEQTEQLLEQIKKYNITDAIVKIIYFLPVGIKDAVNLRIIQEACQNAMFLVGIVPVRQFELKQKRAAIKVDMDLETLLNSYFETKAEYKSKKDILIQKALELENEIEETLDT